MNPRAGLSLFELLVSLALLALISAGLANALDLTVRLYDRTVALPASTASAALRVRLRQWMVTALPPSHPAPFPVDFTGTNSEMAFTTLSAKGFAPEAAALRIEISRDGNALFVHIKTLADDGSVQSEFDHILATDVTPEFAYFDALSNAPGWLADWEDETRLPTLLRIAVPETQKSIWPILVVALAQE